MRKNIAVVIALLFMLCSTQAIAMDQVQWLNDMNPPSSWLNQYERDVQLGFGEFVCDSLGAASNTGVFQNIVVSPVSGLYVSAGPGSSNTQGSLYQLQADETLSFGGYPAGVGSTALPIDNTQICQQGLVNSQSNTLGPLYPPGASGLTIDYLVEAQVAEQDATGQTVSILQPNTSLKTQATANRDHRHIIVYGIKSGSARSSSGAATPPSVDSGWVAIAYVSVPNATSTITNSMITGYPQWYGYISAGPGGITPISSGGTGCSIECFVDLSTNQSIYGQKTFNNTVNISTLTGNSGTFSGTLSATTGTFGVGGVTSPVLNITGTAGVTGNVAMGANLNVTNTITGGTIVSTNAVNAVAVNASSPSNSFGALSLYGGYTPQNGDLGLAYVGSTAVGRIFFGTSNIGAGMLQYNGSAFTFQQNPSTPAYVGLIGSAFTPLSDSRLKKNIHPLKYGLQTVMALRPKSYNLRSNGSRHIGFIAQDVQKLMPELVTDTHDKQHHLALNYNEMLAAVVNAMQQQQHEIQNLQAENKALRLELHHGHH